MRVDDFVTSKEEKYYECIEFTTSYEFENKKNKVKKKKRKKAIEPLWF